MSNKEEIKINRKKFSRKEENFLISAFRALGDVNRYRIFRLLEKCQKMSAGDIADKLKISRPLASQHLKILEQSLLFGKEKVGQHKFYSVNKKNPLVRVFVSAIK